MAASSLSSRCRRAARSASAPRSRSSLAVSRRTWAAARRDALPALRRLRRLEIVLVDDQIGLVVADVRAIVPKTAGYGAGLETKQGFVELGAIVGVVEISKA